MSSDDDVCIIEDSSEESCMEEESEEEQQSSFASSSSPAPTQQPRPSSSSRGSNKMLEKPTSGAPYPFTPTPLPSQSVSTMTGDAVVEDSFTAKARRDLAYWETALSVCLDYPVPETLRRADESNREEKLQQLRNERDRLGRLMKRVRETTTTDDPMISRSGDGMDDFLAGEVAKEEEGVKRLRHETHSPQAVGEWVTSRPAWMDELEALTKQLEQHDKQLEERAAAAASAASSAETPSPEVRYLLQAPPVVEIHHHYPHPDEASKKVNQNTSRAEMETTVDEQQDETQRKGAAAGVDLDSAHCPHCAELQVVLQKERATSILPIYSELWRLRHERSRKTSLQMEELAPQLSWHEHLFDRIKKQMEKEMKFHHERFLRRCALDSREGIPLEELQKDLDALRQLRGEINRLCEQKQPPQQKGSALADGTVVEAPQGAALTMVHDPGLEVRIQMLEEENAALRQKVEAASAASKDWESRYHVALDKLQEGEKREQGVFREEVVRALLANRRREMVNVIKALGWEIESQTPQVVTLVHPGEQGSQLRKEVGLTAATVDGQTVEDTAVVLAKYLLGIQKDEQGDLSGNAVNSTVDSESTVVVTAVAPPFTMSSEGAFQASAPLTESHASEAPPAELAVNGNDSNENPHNQNTANNIINNDNHNNNSGPFNQAPSPQSDGAALAVSTSLAAGMRAEGGHDNGAPIDILASETAEEADETTSAATVGAPNADSATANNSTMIEVVEDPFIAASVDDATTIIGGTAPVVLHDPLLNMENEEECARSNTHSGTPANGSAPIPEANSDHEETPSHHSAPADPFAEAVMSAEAEAKDAEGTLANDSQAIPIVDHNEEETQQGSLGEVENVREDQPQDEEGDASSNPLRPAVSFFSSGFAE